MTKKPDSYWEFIETVWDQINIYDGASAFLNSYSAAKPPVGQLYAAHFAQSEICNGGFHQLFWNSTGVLCPEAVEGFDLIGMPKTSRVLASAMKTLGTPFPRERDERQKALEGVQKDLFDQLNSEFYKELREENGGFEAAANAFVQKQSE